MNEILRFLPQNRFKKALVISLIYVGLGTLSVCSVYPSDTFSGDWAILGMLVTLPVSVISFGYRFGNAKDIEPVFIIQAVTFILTFLLLAFIILKKEDKR